MKKGAKCVRVPLISAAMWNGAQLPHLVEALGSCAGLGVRHGQAPPRAPSDGVRMRAWMEGAASILGMEAEEIEVRGFRVEESLRRAAPAILTVEGEGYLGLLETGRKRAVLLMPDHSTIRVSMRSLRALLCGRAEVPHVERVARLVEGCGIEPGSRRAAAAANALLRERTRMALVARIYALRRPPGASFSDTASAAGLRRMLTMLGAAHCVEYLLLMGSWWLLGRAVLQGQVDRGVLAAWLLLLATILPFRILASSLQGRFAISLGGLLRERLLDGALKLRPEEVRHQGAGAFLSKAIEAEQVESMAISGGMMAVLALLETLLSLCVLAFGSRSALQFAVLAGWIALACWIAHRYYLRRHVWTGHRLDITGKLIEAMTGHRTRLAQQKPEDWHVDEDREVERYAALSRAMDVAQTWLGVVPRAYLVCALAALAPDFLSASPSGGALAASMGAIIIAWQAFRRMAGGLAQISGAVIAWKRVAELFHSSARSEPCSVEAAVENETVLSARDVSFRYGAEGRPVLTGVNLEIRKGDWLLLEGASGGGKSTLVSVLAGLRPASAGLVLAGGLDLPAMGAAAWRRRIAAAPQYHENHVLGNTFAFNLLMGRRWPASEGDLREAEQVCRELGLGPLIERMPAGLFQQVGETGWQLSQGERSRLFLARALLQSPDLVVLDESFAALDPENLRQSLECTLRRARTLLVVAHP